MQMMYELVTAFFYISFTETGKLQYQEVLSILQGDTNKFSYDHLIILIGGVQNQSFFCF